MKNAQRARIGKRLHDLSRNYWRFYQKGMHITFFQNLIKMMILKGGQSYARSRYKSKK